jgi:hypothetical protein
MGTARVSAPHYLSSFFQTVWEHQFEVLLMPLLSLETSLYPSDVLAGEAPLPAVGNRWWVLHTRPRAEKSLARKLLARGTGFFLPLHQR